MGSDKPIVYLIRHGEKPPSGDGLSAQGLERAQCLRKVFGADSGYDIGHIMAQSYKEDGDEERPYCTVKPLADDLHLEIDTCYKRDDAKGVAHAVDHYKGKGNILICWEHKHLKDIVEKISGKCKEYPGDHFNLIWTISPPYDQGVTHVGNEDCPGLDC